MKHEMPLRAGRRVGHPGQHEVDDVVGEVVLAVGDEDLLAGDPPRAVVGRHRPRRQRADVGAGLRLGQVHRAGPLAGDHLRQVDLALGLAAVVQEHVDGALGQQRAQREGHVGRGHDLLHGDADEPREPAAAVLGRERHGRPAGLDVALVGLREAVGVVTVPSSLRRLCCTSPTRLSGANCSAKNRPASSRMPATVVRVGVLVARAARPARRGRRRARARSACPPAAATYSHAVRRYARGRVRDEAGRSRTAARGGGRPSSSRSASTSPRRAVGDDPAVVEDDRARAQLQGVRQVVGDEERRDVEAEDDLGQLAAGHRVEVRRRLVEHEDVGPHRQHGGQGDPPALAEAEVVRRAVGGVGHADGVERLGRARAASSAPRRPRLAGPNATSSRTVGMNSWSSGSWNTMPTRRRISARLARSTASPPTVTDPSARRVDAVEGEHERRLAGAVGSEDGDPLAGARRRGRRRRAPGGRRGRGSARSRTSSAAASSPAAPTRPTAATTAASAGHSRHTTHARAVAGGAAHRHRAGVAPRRHRQVHPLAALVGPHEQGAGRRGHGPGVADPARRRAPRLPGDAHAPQLVADDVAVADHERR